LRKAQGDPLTEIQERDSMFIQTSIAKDNAWQRDRIVRFWFYEISDAHAIFYKTIEKIRSVVLQINLLLKTHNESSHRQWPMKSISRTPPGPSQSRLRLKVE